MPCLPSSWTAFSARSGRSSARITLAPASPSAWALARPMPWPPPVTTATRPERSYFPRYIASALPGSAGLARRRPAHVGERVAAGARHGDALAVEQVAVVALEPDADAVVDPG